MHPLFPYQQREVDATWNKPFWGFCWDCGTGKTAGAIHTAERLEDAGLIQGLVVVAPNGVHRNWHTDELPKHMSDDLWSWTKTLVWYTSKSKTKKFAAEVKEFLEAPDYWFRTLVVSYDGVMIEDCAKVLKKFLQQVRCLLVLDESQFIKSPDAKRTKRVLAMAAYAPYRRILTGTLVVDKPFDVYTQLKFLDPAVWQAIGCGSSQAFRAQFGVWENKWSAQAGRLYPQLLHYRNLDQMQKVVASVVSRVRREDVLGDLPPRTYSRRYFELTPEQRRVYRELRDEALTYLDSGEIVTAPLVITRLMRMQQVTSGYLPADDPDEDGERPMLPLEGANPRLRLLLDLAEEIPGQAIVWAKYRQDVTLILEALQEEGLTACRYDGECDDEHAAESLRVFRAGEARFFVSNPAKGGTGLTLNEAAVLVYYNTSYKLGERIQSEARNHRIGQDRPTHVIDLVGMLTADEPTLDVGILEALTTKHDLAALVQGDEVRRWLRPEPLPG